MNDMMGAYGFMLGNQLDQMQTEAELAYAMSVAQSAVTETNMLERGFDAVYGAWSDAVNWVATVHVGDLVRDNAAALDAHFGLNGWGVGVGGLVGGVWDNISMVPRMPAQFINWANGGPMPEPFQMAEGLWDRASYRFETMTLGGESALNSLFTVGVLGVGDVLGTTDFGEAVTGQSSVEGGLSEQERNAKWVTGGFAMGTNAAGVFVPGIGALKAKFGTGKSVMSSGGAGGTGEAPGSPGLGSRTSMASLADSGQVPGSRGVTLSDHTVKFADVWRLSETHQVEFALTREAGSFRLYSGTYNRVQVPTGCDRIIAHTHTSGNPFPSSTGKYNDIATLNNNYGHHLSANPYARPKPSRVIFGPGVKDYTRFRATGWR